MMKERIIIFVFAVCMTVIAAPAAHGKATRTGQERASGASTASFVGEVVKVDLQTRIMTLRGRGSLINFNLSNVVVKGYGSLAEIKKGQWVAVRYTRDAIHVERTTASAASGHNAQTSSKESTKKPQFARRIRTDGLSFSEIDNNKDGYISPIELCVAIPSLTMDQFRQYDTNHDGRLDRSEFGQIKLR